MYSTNNEEKSVIAERFIRTLLKNKIYKYMTSISKNVFIDKLDDIVNKYNNAYHRTFKMKALDVRPSMYVDFNRENIKKGPKSKVGDNVRISTYKTTFARGYWFEQMCHGYLLLVILATKKLLERFTKKYCKKQNETNLEYRVFNLSFTFFYRI